MITKQTIESSNGIAVRALAQCAVSKPSRGIGEVRKRS